MYYKKAVVDVIQQLLFYCYVSTITSAIKPTICSVYFDDYIFKLSCNAAPIVSLSPVKAAISMANTSQGEIPIPAV